MSQIRFYYPLPVTILNMYFIETAIIENLNFIFNEGNDVPSKNYSPIGNKTKHSP